MGVRVLGSSAGLLRSYGRCHTRARVLGGPERGIGKWDGARAPAHYEFASAHRSQPHRHGSPQAEHMRLGAISCRTRYRRSRFDVLV